MPSDQVRFIVALTILLLFSKLILINDCTITKHAALQYTFPSLAFAAVAVIQILAVILSMVLIAKKFM